MSVCGFDEVVKYLRHQKFQSIHLANTSLGWIPVVTDDGSRETDFGAWEGLTFAEVRELAGRADRVAGRPRGRAPGGSFTQVSDRVTAALHRVLAGDPGQTVLIVSHVTAIKTLFRMHLDIVACPRPTGTPTAPPSFGPTTTPPTEP